MNHNKQDNLEKCLNLAHKAAANPIYLDSQAALGRAAKAWNRSALLALDTEFMRERTYFPLLGLIQISDGQTAWLLDAPALQSLQPLADLLQNPDILKVLHSPSEDLEVFGYALNARPEPLFDTQIAAACLGHPLQLGYNGLVQWGLGVSLDKSETRSNWLRRPLSPRQLRYAAQDVAYLPVLTQRLQQQLAQHERLSWVLEDSRRLLQKAAAGPAPEQQYLSINSVNKLNRKQRTYLQQLCVWREAQAIARDKPRGHILKPQALVELARALPLNDDQLKAVASLPQGVYRRHQKTLLQLAQETENASSFAPPPPEPLSTRQRSALKRLQSKVLAVSDQLAIQPGLLATKKELEYIIRNRSDSMLPKRLRGWRKAVIGDRLLDMLNH